MQPKSDVFSCRKRRSPNGPSSSSSCPTLLWVNLYDELILPSNPFFFSEMSKLIFHNMTWYPKIFILKKDVAFHIIWMGYFVNSNLPMFVLKMQMRNAYCAGPEDDLQLPKESAQVDWEVELGVVIGKGGRYAATIDFYVS